MRLGRALATILVVIGIVATGSYLWLEHEFARTGPAPAESLVEVPRGIGVQEIARRLQAAGAIRQPLVLVAASRLFAGSRPLQAGEYAFPAGASMAEIVQQMQEGRIVVHRVTIPEGLTVHQAMALIAAEPLLTGPVPPTPPEGRVLPETYNFVKGDSRAAVIGRMTDAMTGFLEERMPSIAPGLPYSTVDEVLVLASIVEKETALPDERPRIAGLFVNRLRAGMRLQSDPTVIYGITGGRSVLERELTRADLERPTPYNTYVITGLPVGPIANPGRASIEAVLHPLATEDLYFVADGTGGHAFARTLDEHNANVRRWRLVQKAR